MSFRQVYKIARREYIARVRNKAFIFTTLMVPAFLGIYMLVLPLLFSGTGVEELQVAVLDDGTGLGSKLAERLGDMESPHVEVSEQVQVQGDAEDFRKPYSEAVRKEKLDGYLLLTPDEKITASARYFARETGNPLLQNRLERVVQATVLERILAGSGVDVDQVRQLQSWDLESFTISEAGEEQGGFETALFSTLGFAMLLYMAVLINGQGMAMAIVEEKTSRLIEVILGAVTATEFMIGKILGVLGSGLTQLGIWLGFTAISIVFVLPALALGAAESGFDLASVLNFNILFYFAIFFALGYLLYSTIFAAVAATCTSTEELGQAMFPAMLPFIIAFFSSFYVVGSPSTTTALVLSLIPFFTPLVMLARVNVLMPPLWEVWAGIALLVLGCIVMAWLASKIFRFALLMHGKRPSIPEIVRLIRAS